MLHDPAQLAWALWKGYAKLGGAGGMLEAYVGDANFTSRVGAEIGAEIGLSSCSPPPAASPAALASLVLHVGPHPQRQPWP